MAWLREAIASFTSERVIPPTFDFTAVFAPCAPLETEADTLEAALDTDFDAVATDFDAVRDNEDAVLPIFPEPCLYVSLIEPLFPAMLPGPEGSLSAMRDQKVFGFSGAKTVIGSTASTAGRM